MPKKKKKKIKYYFRSNLNQIKEGNKKLSSKGRTNTPYKLCNIEILYKARNNAIKVNDDNSSTISGAKHEPNKGKRLRILTPK